MSAVVRVNRLELGLAAAILGGIGAWAVLTIIRLTLTSVTRDCISAWDRGVGTTTAQCGPALTAWGALLESEGSRLVAAMSVLPLAAGLICGTPLVAREIEARTAQFSWSIETSRTRWLARQSCTVGLILLGLLIPAAFLANVILGAWADWGEPLVLHAAVHGLTPVARALGCMGLGLLAGALLGRSLPAFLLAGALAVSFGQTTEAVRRAWLDGLPAQPMTGGSAEVQTGWAWREPAGMLLSVPEAMALVPPTVSGLDALRDQPVESIGWLEAAGYTAVPMGVAEDEVLGWQAWDVLAHGGVAIACWCITAVVVARRRPL